MLPGNLEDFIKQVEQMEEEYPGQRREIIRQHIVDTAHDAAFNVIHENYEDGNEEEYRCLCARTAEKLLAHTYASCNAELLKKDLKDRHS